MKPINNRFKDDPVKSAIYNPKEFRGRKTSALSVSSSKSAATKHRPLVYLLMLAVLITGVWYFFIGYEPAIVVPLPATGELQRFHPYLPNTKYGPFRLTASTTSANYLVKLEDWQTGTPVMSIFVRRGEIANVNVPLGTYRCKYAYGTNWYGLNNLFGRETIVVQAVLPLAFTIDSTQIHGKFIDLTPRVTGNLHTIPRTQNNF